MHLVIKDKTMWYKFRKHEKRRDLSQLSISQALVEADIMWQNAEEQLNLAQIPN